MNQLTIFHINTERTFRGGEVQTLLLAKQLQVNGHQNFVFAQKKSLLAQEARGDGLITLELGMRGEWDLYAARKIRKAIRDNSPGILHAHTPHACALAILARGRRSLPAIVFSRRISAPLKRTTKYRQVDALLAVSPAIR
ncbi:MAG TPA: glycosyltransferase, partial [Acidobacteriota bacterium]|nr:glycosyltransferase [Acidobacteriota bacterium]